MKRMRCTNCRGMRGGALKLLLVLTGCVAGNSLLARSHQRQVQPGVPPAVAAQALRRLAAAVRIQTVSIENQPDASGEAFLDLHRHLSASFPKVHQAMRKEVINRYSLLFTWPGTQPDLPPIILMAHQDVVPVAPGTHTQWTHDPFGGTIADGHVWGRGAWDDKGGLMAMLEAAERLISEGYQPCRTVYFAFGHDEEMGAQGGQRGAKAIAALLRGRHVRAQFALDEGLLVTQGTVKGVKQAVALIGIAEKGYLTVKLQADATAGHSSSPPRHTAIGNLAQAITQIQAHPFPRRMTAPTEAMFAGLAPVSDVFQRLVLSNLWLTSPLVLHQVGQQPSGDAMLRTTMAWTTVHGGDKENVLPGTASASLNLRLLPGDSAADAFGHVARLADDVGVRAVREEPYWEASRVADTHGMGYAQINQAIRETFPGTVVVPGLMIGATDSRYMDDVAEHVYRFTPIVAGPGDLARFHGTDERVSVEGYRDMMTFYERLIHAATSPAK